MKLDELFDDGKWVSDEEYEIQCRICGGHPTNHRCYLNPVKGVYHCFHCGAGGNLAWFIKKYGDADALQYGKGTELRKPHHIIPKPQRGLIDFNQFKKVNESEGMMGNSAEVYLKGRGITEEEIEKYDFRYGTHGRYYGRVLMPICENGKMVSFSARAFYSHLKPKFLFPYANETLITVSEAIWRYDEALEQEPAIIGLSEGIFDALAVDRIEGMFGISIMTKALSQGQLFKLLRLPKNSWFIVILDADAYSSAMAVAKQLSIYERKVFVACLEHDDPAELTHDELQKTIALSKEFSHELETEVFLHETH